MVLYELLSLLAGGRRFCTSLRFHEGAGLHLRRLDVILLCFAEVTIEAEVVQEFDLPINWHLDLEFLGRELDFIHLLLSRLQFQIAVVYLAS